MLRVPGGQVDSLVHAASHAPVTRLWVAREQLPGQAGIKSQRNTWNRGEVPALEPRGCSFAGGWRSRWGEVPAPSGGSSVLMSPSGMSGVETLEELHSTGEPAPLVLGRDLGDTPRCQTAPPPLSRNKRSQRSPQVPPGQNSLPRDRAQSAAVPLLTALLSPEERGLPRAAPAARPPGEVLAVSGSFPTERCVPRY